jgi:protection of telomeres protein 1
MPLPNGFTAIKDATRAGAQVNFLGVVVSVKSPEKTRGTDWRLDFEIQDDFTSGHVGSDSTINVRLFKSRNTLPKISGPGDVVILRDFTLNGWGMRVDCVGNSRSRSAVLVFPANKIPMLELSQAYQLGTKHLEYDATYGSREPTRQEEVAVIQLKAAASASVKQVQQHAAASSFKASKPEKLSLIKDLEFNRFSDVRAEVLNVYYTDIGTVELKVTDYTANDALFCYIDPAEANSSWEPIDVSWKGPYGQLTLNVILWENNAAWARENVSIGDYVFLKNMRVKISPLNKLEGALHQDRERPTQIDIRKLINQSEINEIRQRQEEYNSKRRDRSALDGLKDTVKDAPLKKEGKKVEKKKRQQALKQAEQKELAEKAELWAAERGGINTNSKLHSSLSRSC